MVRLFPATPSFSDVPRTAWYYPYIETAAHEGWIRGDGNCYGTASARCTVRPASDVNRAEMATMLQRAFRLSHLRLARIFSDNTDTSTWYHVPVQIAADHCVLQGDELGDFVRPSASMNRAEMIVMSYRAGQQLRYGQDCSTPTGEVLDVDTFSSNAIRVTYNIDIDPNSIDNLARYSVEELNGTNIGIADVYVINARTVEISLNRSLSAGTSYRLRINTMRTEAGNIFHSVRTFVAMHGNEEQVSILSTTILSSNSIRLTFSHDLEKSRVEDESRYSVTRLNTTGTLGVRTATLVGSRTVDLVFDASVVAEASYRITVSNLKTSLGTVFNDNVVFSLPVTTGHILNIEPISFTRLRITFDTVLDELIAEQSSRYALSSGTNTTVAIASADLIGDGKTVELTLSQSLAAQHVYTLATTNLLTTGNVFFSHSKTFVFGNTTSVSLNVSLRGNQEVPAVTTAASGTGVFTLNSNGLQYNITVQNLSGSITGAHLHFADTGVNGPVVHTITFTGNSASGTWVNLTDEQRTAILSGDIYVNVHTSVYSDGEIRGQLMIQ